MDPAIALLAFLTLLNVAMYDAMIATWDAKYAYNRPRPTAIDSSLTAAVPVPNSRIHAWRRT